MVPVSIKLKTTVKTTKGICIVRKAERMLMNERIRSINHTITMLNCQIYTCMNILEGMINREVMEECHDFINHIRERRHSQTMERQKKKFEMLWQINTGGHPNIHNGGDGYHQENGTEVTSSEETERTTTSGKTTTTAVNNHKVNQVHNLSKTPPTGMQEKALAHGPNFVVVAREPPVSEYISQIERVCQQLKQGKVEELRAETKQIFMNIQPPKPNIRKEEAKAKQDLKRDKERIVLTAGKEVSMVVMYKDDYIRKSEELLHQLTYKELPTDPTTKHKNRLISLLKTNKSEGGIENITYKRLYPTGAGSPKYYGLPKIHKTCVPLRPIISSRGSATYETVKELAKILKPW